MSDVMVFALTALTAYRAYRFWALDSWPPIKWLRERVEAAVDRRFGDDWADGVTCGWCVGTVVFSFATVGAVWYFRPLTLPALWFAAVATVVGLVAHYEDV